jgi:hypothetical protein
VPVILVIAAAESALEIKLAKKACQPNQELSFAAGRKIFPIAHTPHSVERLFWRCRSSRCARTGADFNFAASVCCKMQ